MSNPTGSALTSATHKPPTPTHSPDPLRPRIEAAIRELYTKSANAALAVEKWNSHPVMPNAALCEGLRIAFEDAAMTLEAILKDTQSL